MPQGDRVPVWHPGLSVGNALLDKQHILLMELARSLADDAAGLGAPSLQAGVEDILQLAERHCAAEEHQLALNGYEWVEQHREEHAAGLHRIRSVLAQSGAGAFSNAAVCATVVEWLADHLSDMDLPARGYLRRDSRVDPNQPDPLDARTA